MRITDKVMDIADKMLGEFELNEEIVDKLLDTSSAE